MKIPTDKALKQYIRDRQKALKINTARLERLSGFYGLRPYLATDGRSISILNACKVAAALEVAHGYD